MAPGFCKTTLQRCQSLLQANKPSQIKVLACGEPLTVPHLYSIQDAVFRVHVPHQVALQQGVFGDAGGMPVVHTRVVHLNLEARNLLHVESVSNELFCPENWLRPWEVWEAYFGTHNVATPSQRETQEWRKMAVWHLRLHSFDIYVTTELPAQLRRSQIGISHSTS